MAANGESYLCDREQGNTRAQESVKTRKAEQGDHGKWGYMPNRTAQNVSPGKCVLGRSTRAMDPSTNSLGAWR